MAYREVTMIEVKEVLRQWLAGVRKKRIAARLRIDPKTVRRYVSAGESAGLRQGQDAKALTDEVLHAVQASLHSSNERQHGEAWARCEAQRQYIKRSLESRVRLSKIRRLLLRNGVDVPYSTLHRYAVAELDFGRTAATVPVADGKPGEEVHLDTGWVGWLDPGPLGGRRRFRAWIFTPHFSRYRFVYPCFAESTATAIEACEAAWEFYDGVFGVIVPDNTKAIVREADPLDPKIVIGFLEYAQARGFHIDPARKRSPKDKARVERSVRDTRDDCFGGEHLATIEDARSHARRWYAEEYGRRRHSTTRRMPREHFESEERACLLPAPVEPYEIPIWSDAVAGRDHFARVAKGLYSLPDDLIGKALVARADRTTVRFYRHSLIVKTHPRVADGERSIDRSDFPAEQMTYAMRDVTFLANQADEHGEAVGRYARALLAGPLPWARMRQVRALISLARKYGGERVNATCKAALAADLVDVRRLERMIQIAVQPEPTAPTAAKVIPLARYMRPASHYALPRSSSTRSKKKDNTDE